ncbi:DNA-directed RNA polymerase III, subunit Rpc31 [Roridomyces roridus]|uniref:DNA-directed RNA polymerase III, subunit Rpc31 n=1 Tax=Roridomyces roridus TaxID=1738132 RepID=A0AAD7C0L6_9AGAR|nr:DNA-directed RNA polymerase III, subunit Rpc31 [Roridomyces roridus]
MGLTHADLQNMSREATAMYPSMIPPVLSEYTEDEKQIAAYQIGFTQRLRKSAYYVVEATKSTELPKYSDKYRTSANSQPTLKKKDLHAPYFPPNLFDAYFNPKKKRQAVKLKAKKMNIDDLGEDDEEKEPSDASDAGSDAPESDYDVDEEYDNDYADNYFDNGEGDDNDDLGGGGGGDEGGGGDYD